MDEIGLEALVYQSHESPNGSQVHLSLGLGDESLLRATRLVEILRCGGSALRANSLMAPRRAYRHLFWLRTP